MEKLKQDATKSCSALVINGRCSGPMKCCCESNHHHHLSFQATFEAQSLANRIANWMRYAAFTEVNSKETEQFGFESARCEDLLLCVAETDVRIRIKCQMLVKANISSSG
uniref:Uncharacterized protein n=1 Tax=Romanomermis culicivorax TaxID=13658 RepID=A0A915HGD7_ROMCU